MSEIDYTETCRRDPGKTPGATGLVRINYKEDFELVVELLADGKPYPLGDEDFRIDFTVMASRYSVGREGGARQRRRGRPRPGRPARRGGTWSACATCARASTPASWSWWRKSRTPPKTPRKTCGSTPPTGKSRADQPRET